MLICGGLDELGKHNPHNEAMEKYTGSRLETTRLFNPSVAQMLNAVCAWCDVAAYQRHLLARVAVCGAANADRMKSGRGRWIFSLVALLGCPFFPRPAPYVRGRGCVGSFDTNLKNIPIWFSLPTWAAPVQLCSLQSGLILLCERFFSFYYVEPVLKTRRQICELLFFFSFLLSSPFCHLGSESCPRS